MLIYLWAGWFEIIIIRRLLFVVLSWLDVWFDWTVDLVRRSATTRPSPSVAQANGSATRTALVRVLYNAFMRYSAYWALVYNLNDTHLSKAEGGGDDGATEQSQIRRILYMIFECASLSLCCEIKRAALGIVRGNKSRSWVAAFHRHPYFAICICVYIMYKCKYWARYGLG